MLKRIKESLSYLKWDSVFTRMVWTMALPIFVQSFMGQALNLIDNLMVSQLGDAPYAGIAQANRFTMVAHVMLFGVSSGTSIFVAQFWGAKQIDNMKKANGLGMVSGLIISTVLMLVALFFAEPVMSLFLRPGDSFRAGADYLRTIAVMFPLAAITHSYGVALRCEEKTKYPMIAGTASVVCNTILNYLLIEGHFGFPRLEVVGAGIATVIAAAVHMLLLMYYGITRSQSGRATPKELLSFDFAFVKKFIKTASPVMLNESLWSTGIATYSIFYGLRGDVSVAALGVFNSIDGILFLGIYALTGTTAVVVGKALGAGDNEKAMLYSKRMLAGSMAISIVLGLIVILFVNPLVSIFGNLSAEALTYARTLVIVNSFFIWARSFNATMIVGILRAGGDSVASLILDVIFLWFMGIPLVGIAAYLTDWPIYYLYLLSLSDEVMKTIFGSRRFVSRKWMRNLTES